MSVNKTIYTYYGVFTEFNHKLNDDIRDTFERNVTKYGWDNIPFSADCDILADGMSGEYMLLGRRLFDSRSDAQTHFLPNLGNLEETRQEYMEKFKELYPAHYDWLNTKTWHIVTLAHYT